MLVFTDQRAKLNVVNFIMKCLGALELHRLFLTGALSAMLAWNGNRIPHDPTGCCGSEGIDVYLRNMTNPLLPLS